MFYSFNCLRALFFEKLIFLNLKYIFLFNEKLTIF